MVHQLVIGLRERRPEIQTSFVNEYAPRVYAFIRGIVGDSSDADELTADVFVKAIESIGRYDESKASLATWLMRIARNIAVSHLRRPRFLTRSLDAKCDLADEEDEEDPKVELLKKAMQRLNLDERAMLHMHYFENSPIAEISYMLGISESATTVRLHRIRQKLKKMIEEYEREGI